MPLTVVDKKFDIGLEEDKLASHSYFGKIMRHNPSYLFHYTNIVIKHILYHQQLQKC